MTQKFKVLVTRKWPSSVQEKLRQTFDVTLNLHSDIQSQIKITVVAQEENQ